MKSTAPMGWQAAPYWWLPGSISMGFIVLLIIAPFVALLQHFDTDSLLEPWANPWLRRVIGFSFYQAFWSTLLSIGFAIPVARALSRRGSFRGRRLLLNLFSVALVIPSIVAVFGLIAVFGNTGWIAQWLSWLGIDATFSIYGLAGILLAHVFFNLPLATRVLLQSLQSIPESNWKLASQLGMSPMAQFRILEWPACRSQLVPLALLIFTLCFTSFAIVMTLGGGPRATTIEVAIYQALRFDFDLGTAISLAIVQTCCCAGLMLLSISAKLNESSLLGKMNPQPALRYENGTAMAICFDYVVILLAWLFVFTPLFALAITAVNPALTSVLLSARTLLAGFNTVWVSCLSGACSVLLGLGLISAARHLSVRRQYRTLARIIELPGLAILVIPPVVLGTGLYLLLRPYADVFSLALVLVILVNALMGLPFVLRILSVPARQCAERYDKLCASLAITGGTRLRLIEWPLLRKPVGLAMAIATTLSAGDLTVIALFGSERVATLPLLLYQRMGSYRHLEAASTALILLLTCLALFWILERFIGGRNAAT